MPAVASTTPPVLIAAAAARTERIRVGSGGVMLPNHSPLVVAEQFAALEAVAPGRIDLGIGRAPGSDPVITRCCAKRARRATWSGSPSMSATSSRWCSAEGASVRFTSGGTYDVHATPAATGAPEVWLLGSSDYSAQLAAGSGCRTCSRTTSRARASSGRSRCTARFQPTEANPEPRTFLTVNAIAAPTPEEAEARVAAAPAHDGAAAPEQAARRARDRRAGARRRRRVRRTRASRSWRRRARTGSSAPGTSWLPSSPPSLLGTASTR